MNKMKNFKKYLINYIIFLKILITFFIFIFYTKNKNIFMLTDSFLINDKYIQTEKENYFQWFYPLNSLENSSLINVKKNILSRILNDMNKGKALNFANEIFFNVGCRFGNCLIYLNKFIFYCQIVGCKSIILNKKVFWFLKNDVKLEEYNLTIKTKDITKYNNSFIIGYNSGKLFYEFFNIKPEIRIHLLRDEILNNLPKINISTEDLFIHIRSDDMAYGQPPLCFYQYIIQNFIFRKVHIISSDKGNPVIPKLIKEYPEIIYKNNELIYDISFLINSFNIVASISSFLTSIIQLNYNLKLLFDYNLYRMRYKILHYHYDLYKYPHNNFTILRMEPSFLYKKKMLNWKYNKKIKKIMIKEKCTNFCVIVH